MIDPGLVSFKLTYEISPITLTGGVAANMPGGLVPIVSITQAQDFTDGLLSGAGDIGLYDYFASFRPIPGSSLLDVALGKYPFANQVTAANAIIAQPLRVSLLMISPVKTPGGYPAKLAQFQAIQGTLQQHSALGGTYTVATPAYLYTNCILTGLRDVTDAASKQAQTTWQWDFEQPLLTQQQAQQVQNSLIAKISGRVPVDGDPPRYSGTGPAVANPGSSVGPSLIPAAQPLGGAFGVSPAPAGAIAGAGGGSR